MGVRITGKIDWPFLTRFHPSLTEVFHVAWRGAPLEMTDGTKGGAQRARSLRPRCFGVVDLETATQIYLSVCLSIRLSVCLSIYLSIYLFIYLTQHVFGGTDTTTEVSHDSQPPRPRFDPVTSLVQSINATCLASLFGKGLNNNQNIKKDNN
jgi:hypothetical protein